MTSHMPIELKILIAEDNKSNQQLMFRILENIGCKPVLAENGIQVLKAMDQEDFDVILMDIQMPEMDGLTATKLIRLHYSKEKQPIIIALTASTSKGEKESYLKTGIDSVLTKPVQCDELITLLERFSEVKLVSPKSEDNSVFENIDQELTIFDSSMVQDLIEMLGVEETDVVIQFIDLYTQEASKTIDQMQVARNKGDNESLLKLLHKLRGSSGQLGGVKLGNLCQILETQLKQALVENLEGKLIGIDQANKELVIELDRFTKQLP